MSLTQILNRMKNVHVELKRSEKEGHPYYFTRETAAHLEADEILCDAIFKLAEHASYYFPDTEDWARELVGLFEDLPKRYE